MAFRFSLGVVYRNRDDVAANGRQYGVVAFFFSLATSSFKPFPLHNPEGYEILATVGSIKGVKRRVFCLAVYEPPNLTLLRARQMHEYILNILDEAKPQFAECSIILAGDWPVEEAVEDHLEIHEIPHGNTRGGRAIDRSFTNFSRSIVECGSLPPLESEEGAVSDHRIAYAKAELKRPKPPTINYSYRHFTEQGATQFWDLLASQSWDPVTSAVGTSAKVGKFQSILDSLIAVCFVMKTTTKRVTDPPWVNNKIRKLSKKRRTIYDREGRSPRWKELKKQCKDLYNRRARAYMEEQKKTLTAPDVSRAFFKNVKAYQTREKPNQFDVRDLYPETPDIDIAGSLADHFNAISCKFRGLTPKQIPDADPGFLPFLSVQEVVSRLVKFRKTKSKVQGDVFPGLVNRAAPHLAIPLTHIFNAITVSHEWPELWKIEYVTPIPKKGTPQSPNDLRNISCTQLLSKIY